MEVRKGPLPPFPFPCEGQFPQHYKYSAGEGHCQALAELVVTRDGCWLLGKPGEGAQGPPRPQAPCALRFTLNSPWWWVLGVGCGAYDCDCVWVCASDKARRCCSCMCHAAAPVLPLLHLVVVVLPPPFLVLVLMQVLVLLLMPLVLVHLLLLLFLIVLLPLLATAAVPLLALVQQRAARRETTYPV